MYSAELLLELIENKEGKNKSASSIDSKNKAQRTPPEHISPHLAVPKNSRNPKKTLKGHTEPKNPDP